MTAFAAPSGFSGAYDDLSGKPTLATVATSGAYADLSGKPTAPVAFTETKPSTSGTAIDFTSIPAGTKRVVVGFRGISIASNENTIVQLGDSGGIETTGYDGSVAYINNAAASAVAALSTGFSISGGGGANTAAQTGTLTLELIDPATNTWHATGQFGTAATHTILTYVAGAKSLSAVLDRIRVTTAAGNVAFDAGAISIRCE